MSATEDLRDRILAHELGLRRVEGGLVRDILRLLDQGDRHVRARMRYHYRRLLRRGASPGFTAQRLEQMFAEIRAATSELQLAASEQLASSLIDAAQQEVEWTRRAFAASMPEEIRALVEAGRLAPITIPGAIVLEELVKQSPFQTRLLGEHFSHLAAAKQARLEKVVRLGILEGRGIAPMARQVARQLRIVRHQAATLVRTAVGSTMNRARERTFQENQHLGPGVQWLSTLDLRTTVEYCVPRDGKRYDHEHNPIDHSLPWLDGPGAIHFGCRSTSIFVFGDLSHLGLDAEKLSPATRASMDGQVPAKMNAEEWLNKQPMNRLEQVFGKKRARLFRDGGLSVEDMLKGDGELWTLKELMAREAEAFRLAGLEVAA